MNFFENVPLAPPDPILGLTAAFNADPRKEKINLGVGLYMTEALVTPVLESVKSAEAELLDEEKSKGYLGIDGEQHYLEQMGALVFGEELWQTHQNRTALFQTVGGTGALKIGGTFLKEEAVHPLLVSMPTWPNHRGVFTYCGLTVVDYPYYNLQNHTFDIHQMLAFLETYPAGTIVVLHASCHNPTGCDPTSDQWKTLYAFFKEKQLIPFFDFAYQGLGDGVNADAEAIRLFLQNGLEMLIAVSNAKNFSLYGERVGCLMIVSETPDVASHIKSRVKQMIRTNYSNPPMHGAKIVAHILRSPALRKKWEDELGAMRRRIQTMRILLSEKLNPKRAGFAHIERGKGMFAYTGLQKSQVEALKTEFAIYTPSDGRINVCGLNVTNCDYVVDAIIAVANK